jgi:hypothetical protein
MTATWRNGLKGLVSLWIAWHVLSVVVAALGARPPASRLERDAVGLFRPYYELINQGTSHRYYAPEPAPTPIVTARLSHDDGREETLRIPDRGLRPRLLYQRHLALANYLAEEARMARAENRPSLWAQSYGKHLCASRNGCTDVTLLVQYHLIPSPGELLEHYERTGRALDVDAEEFYSVAERVGEVRCRPQP